MSRKLLLLSAFINELPPFSYRQSHKSFILSPALPQFLLFCSVCCPIFALKTFLAARPLQKNIFIYYSSSSSIFLFFPPLTVHILPSLPFSIPSHHLLRTARAINHSSWCPTRRVNTF
ncbi:unnamed protein product [Meloidogyne enterolobii]|uniref:Uncharacterized protein n=1 Tax=Meloidogyne enterolobii TaxID=390850 RepID=A0ACB0ZDE9_MELEN